MGLLGVIIMSNLNRVRLSCCWIGVGLGCDNMEEIDHIDKGLKNLSGKAAFFEDRKNTEIGHISYISCVPLPPPVSISTFTVSKF